MHSFIAQIKGSLILFNKENANNERQYKKRNDATSLNYTSRKYTKNTKIVKKL
jgi:hypothetical protein